MEPVGSVFGVWGRYSGYSRRCGLLGSPTKGPERKGLPRPKAGILVVDQLKPAVFEGTAVGFPLPENQGVERTSIFGDSDLNDQLVVQAPLFGGIQIGILWNAEGGIPR
jgi:hypothetical protein